MNPRQRISEMLEDAKELNVEVRAAEGMTLADAHWIVSACRETEGWLKGVRELLEIK